MLNSFAKNYHTLVREPATSFGGAEQLNERNLMWVVYKDEEVRRALAWNLASAGAEFQGGNHVAKGA